MSIPTSLATFRRFVAGLAVILPLALAACGDDSDESASPSESGSGTASEQPAAGPEPTTLSITTSDAGEDRFATEAPPSIEGGLVKVVFKNAGTAPHEAQLIRVDEGHTAQEALEIIESEDPATPEWIHGAGGVRTIPPGQQGTTFTNLAPGQYAVIDLFSGEEEGPSPASRGAMAEFEVTPGEPGELPPAEATIVAKDEAADDEDVGEHRHSFEATGLKAGMNTTVLFDNRSHEIHHVVLAPIVGDTPIEQVTQALASDEPPSGPPPLDFENATITSVLDGKAKEVITDLELQPGRYALLCFISDREGGKEHFQEGMIQEVTLR